MLRRERERHLKFYPVSCVIVEGNRRSIWDVSQRHDKKTSVSEFLRLLLQLPCVQWHRPIGEQSVLLCTTVNKVNMRRTMFYFISVTLLSCLLSSSSYTKLITPVEGMSLSHDWSGPTDFLPCVLFKSRRGFMIWHNDDLKRFKRFIFVAVCISSVWSQQIPKKYCYMILMMFISAVIQHSSLETAVQKTISPRGTFSSCSGAFTSHDLHQPDVVEFLWI